MIFGLFHQGSGLGNQLHRYVATRVLALDKGYGFSMIAPNLFKGSEFMNINIGLKLRIPYQIENVTGKVFVDEGFWVDKLLPLWEEKTNYYNPEFNFIKDNTIIDGEFQDERYFGHRMEEIDQWLKVESVNVPDDTCVIGFRGGEFSVFPELFLTREYWDKGIEMMKAKGITKFEIHTDDEVLAKQWFPDYKVIHDAGINWRSMRYAKYAIIANSSFYILPRLLSKSTTIAPRYWARRNTKQWSMPQNFYKSFQYI